MAPKPRACGTCSACCSALRIDELNKSPHVACDRLSAVSKGCGRYAERPLSCARFRCAWLDGVLPAEMRPDRVGFIVWSTEALAEHKGMLVNECTPRAFSRPENMRFLKQLSAKHPLVLTPIRGAQAVVGPDGAAHKVRLALVDNAEPVLLDCDVEVDDAGLEIEPSVLDPT